MARENYTNRERLSKLKFLVILGLSRSASALRYNKRPSAWKDVRWHGQWVSARQLVADISWSLSFVSDVIRIPALSQRFASYNLSTAYNSWSFGIMKLISLDILLCLQSLPVSNHWPRRTWKIKPFCGLPVMCTETYLIILFKGGFMNLFSRVVCWEKMKFYGNFMIMISIVKLSYMQWNEMSWDKSGKWCGLHTRQSRFDAFAMFSAVP